MILGNTEGNIIDQYIQRQEDMKGEKTLQLSSHVYLCIYTSCKLKRCHAHFDTEQSFTHVSVCERDSVLCSIKAFCSVVFFFSTQSVWQEHVTSPPTPREAHDNNFCFESTSNKVISEPSHGMMLSLGAKATAAPYCPSIWGSINTL